MYLNLQSMDKFNFINKSKITIVICKVDYAMWKNHMWKILGLFKMDVDD